MGRLATTDHFLEWPQGLRDAAQGSRNDTASWRPIVIDMAQANAKQQLAKLTEGKRVSRVVDNYDEQFAELIVSRHPQLYRASAGVKKQSLKDYFVRHYAGAQSWQLGSWVYFPWNGDLVHVLEKDLFLEVRTIRNKDLITAKEQSQYVDFNVGCAGMSVGSNVALSLAITGGSQRLKIADGATISASNLNRIITGVSDVGSSKSLVIARKLYEMNPYMNIERYAENITQDSIDDFFEKGWQLDAIVDEIDDLQVKILLRIEARKRRIPVIMVTDLGDDVMLDVERYDLDSTLPLFHGLVKDIESLLTRQVSKGEWIKYATAIVEPGNTPLRMQQSLLKIGTELVTQPQLGGTALMAGAVAAYAVRQIALGEELDNGRTLISLDKHLRADLKTWKYKRQHYRHTKQLKRTLKAM